MAYGVRTYIFVDKARGVCITAIKKKYNCDLAIAVEQQRPISQNDGLRIRQFLLEAGFIYGKDFYLKIVS